MAKGAHPANHEFFALLLQELEGTGRDIERISAKYWERISSNSLVGYSVLLAKAGSTAFAISR